MKEDEFKEWLDNEKYPHSKVTVNNRMANTKKVANKYDLDEAFAKDEGKRLLMDFEYTVKDERNNVEKRHRIEINGVIRTGTATLKQSIKLYFQFRNFESELSEYKLISDKKCAGGLVMVLNQIIDRFEYNSKEHEDVSYLQESIKEYLQLKMKAFSWKTEYKPCKSNGDRIDIYGDSDESDYKVVIELDAHRADQVAKKFLSRMALLENENVIYIALCYPGTKNMSVNETKKYFNYCTTITNLLSKNSKVTKTFSGIILKNKQL